MDDEKLYQYRGKDYTIHELMKFRNCKNGNNLWTFYNKLKKHNYNVQDAMDDVGFDVYWFENKWCSTSDLLASPKCKIPRGTLESRLRKGKSPEDAIMQKSNRKTKHYENPAEYDAAFNLLTKGWI